MSDVDARCPQCGAHVRAAADWCSLCYAGLRPAPEPAPVPAPEIAPADKTAAAGALPPKLAARPQQATDGEAASGRHARRVAVTATTDFAVTDTTDTADKSGESAEDALGADAMLAMLAAESGSPLGGAAGRLTSPGVRVGVMIGGVVLVSLVLLAVMMLVGSLL
ncbi:MAG: hypothetical protein ACXV3S_06695 [Kineosporiaceae bacterium]